MSIVKKPLWLYLCMGLLAMGFGVVLIYAVRRPPALPPVVVFSPGYQIPPQKPPIPDRWISRNWGWYWGFKQRIFGPAKTITLTATVLEFTSSPKELLSSLGLDNGIFTSSNGLHIWITNAPTLSAIRKQLPKQSVEVIAAPRVSTGDAVHSQMMQSRLVTVGGAPINVGVALECFPRIHRDSTDLTAILRLSDAITNNPVADTFGSSNDNISVVTNFEIAARLQIPRGSGVFLLDANPSKNGGKWTGLMISADFTPPQKAGFSSRLTRVIMRTNLPPIKNSQ